MRNPTLALRHIQPNPQVPGEEWILLKRPFADSGINMPDLCLTKLRAVVGSNIDLSWDEVLPEELLQKLYENIFRTKPFILGYIFCLASIFILRFPSPNLAKHFCSIKISSGSYQNQVHC